MRNLQNLFFRFLLLCVMLWCLTIVHSKFYGVVPVRKSAYMRSSHRSKSSLPPGALPLGFWGMELEFYALPSDARKIGIVVEQFGGKTNVSLGMDGNIGQDGPAWVLQMDEGTLTSGYINVALLSSAQEVMNGLGCETSTCQVGLINVSKHIAMSQILSAPTTAIESSCCGCHVRHHLRLTQNRGDIGECCPKAFDYERVCYTGLELISKPARDTDVDHISGIVDAINNASDYELIADKSAGFHVHVSAALVPNSTQIPRQFTGVSLVRLLLLYVLSTGNMIFLDDGPAFIETTALLCSRKHQLIHRDSLVAFYNISGDSNPNSGLALILTLTATLT